MDKKDEFNIPIYNKQNQIIAVMPIVFDQVHKKWMQQILEFVKKVASEKKKYINYLNLPGYEFLGTAETIADQLFYLLMKDELSGANKNIFLDQLCEYITKKGKEIDEIELIENKNYMINLCVMYFNDLLIASFYDFYIGMWSCFESAINNLCLPFEIQIKKDLENSNYKKMTKFMMKYIDNKDEKIKFFENIEKDREIFNKKFPKYVSFQDKINHLFKNRLKSYTRDINKDKEVLLFCGQKRNTLHNNGLNRGKDRDIEIQGVLFKLEKDKIMYSDDIMQNNMILINEIFDIYCEIIKSAKKDIFEK